MLPLMIVLLMWPFYLFAQTETIIISFIPVYKNAPLQLEDKWYYMNDGDSARINGFRFYVSSVQLLKEGRHVFEEPNSFHLVDAADKNSQSVVLKKGEGVEYDQLVFNVGVDSINNVSGAIGGDLDPTKGMYWTWQSGYINVKLEGNSNLSKTRNNAFTFHLGGYQPPFATCKKVVLNATQNQQVNIQVDLSSLINKTILQQHSHIMRPGKEATSLSEEFLKAFTVFQQ
jgi:hypothetical protein